MEQQLFTREGRPQEANATLNGKPGHSHLVPCHRCGGQGGGPQWAHTGWTCYECNGKRHLGTAIDPLYTQAELDTLNARRDKLRARKEAKRQARLAEIEAQRAAQRGQFLVDNAALLAKLDALVAADSGEFWQDVRAGIVDRVNVTERQAELVETRHAEMVAKAAAAAKNHHFGQPGERAKRVRVTVGKSLHLFTSFYGERWLVPITTEDGAALSWFTTCGHKAGPAVASFTVKELAEYRGQPQTIVQRVKFHDQPDA